MDWIDEKLEYIKEKMKMTSLKKSLGIYIIVAILAVATSYITTVVFCEGWRELIYQKYNFTTNSVFNSYRIPSINELNLTTKDSNLILVIELVEKGSILLYSIMAIAVTSHIFFRNRLQEPINLLLEEVKYISRNDLSFVCCYESGDEMGEICSAFDKMRIQLSKNQENMWNMMEEQRKLNAAFAHDLRTPLTVMQGYTELLVKYYPQGKISEEKLLETLTLIEAQVKRLKKFSETMKGIHTFEAMEIKCEKNKLEDLEERVKDITISLQEHHGITINIKNKLPKEEVFYDEHIILEVVENLISNALYYAHSQIDIVLEKEDKKLYLYIKDNGNGFSKEDLYMASRPYYSNRADSNEHFGIGLTICKLLCEKHGGNLSLSNSTRGGAIVCASFFII